MHGKPIVIILACHSGDPAEGERLVAPIKAQAAVLAAQLCGDAAARFVLEDWPVQLKISGIEIFSAGSLGAAGEQLVLLDEAAGVYRRLVLQGDRLVAAVLVGDKRDGIWYAQLIPATGPV